MPAISAPPALCRGGRPPQYGFHLTRISTHTYERTLSYLPSEGAVCRGVCNKSPEEADQVDRTEHHIPFSMLDAPTGELHSSDPVWVGHIH